MFIVNQVINDRSWGRKGNIDQAIEILLRGDSHRRQRLVEGESALKREKASEINHAQKPFQPEHLRMQIRSSLLQVKVIKRELSSLLAECRG